MRINYLGYQLLISRISIRRSDGLSICHSHDLSIYDSVNRSVNLSI